MSKAGKTITILVLVGTVAGIASLQGGNGELFQGNIGAEAEPVNQINGLPDLTAGLTVLPPLEGNEDIIAEMTIRNVGEARVSSAQKFSYSLFLDGVEVINNSDSYTTINPGDEFTVKYPVPRTIYQYGDSGRLEFTIDPDNSLPESNEANNTVSADYNF